MCNLLSHASFTNMHRGLTASFTRRLAAGLIAAPLMLGTASVSACVFATPAGAATVLPWHGAWRGVLPTGDGEVLTGAETEMKKGGLALFGVDGKMLTIKLTNPAWDLKVGFRPRVDLEIDGEVFTGRGIVTSRDMIEIPDLRMDILKGFVDGAQAILDINDGEIVWTFDLNGFTAAMSDVVKAYKVSY